MIGLRHTTRMAAAAAVMLFVIVLGLTTIAFWGFLRREFRAIR